LYESGLHAPPHPLQTQQIPTRHAIASANPGNATDGPGSESVTNCHRLKLAAADGKRYLADVATAETLLRLVKSVPSPKARTPGTSDRALPEVKRGRVWKLERGCEEIARAVVAERRYIGSPRREPWDLVRFNIEPRSGDISVIDGRHVAAPRLA
jgi:hypothetical protein